MRQFTETNYKLLLGMVRMALTSTKFDYSVSRTDGESIEFSDPCTGIRGIFEVDADKSLELSRNVQSENTQNLG